MTKIRSTVCRSWDRTCRVRQHHGGGCKHRLLIGLVVSATAIGGCATGPPDSDGSPGDSQRFWCVGALDRASNTFAHAPYPVSIGVDAGYVLVEEAWDAAEPCLVLAGAEVRETLETNYAEALHSECTKIVGIAERMLREASDQSSDPIDAGYVLVEARPAAVVVAGHEDLAAPQPRHMLGEDGVQVAERDVADHPHFVVVADEVVPSLDHRSIHLVGVGEGPVAVADDVAMPEMMI